MGWQAYAQAKRDHWKPFWDAGETIRVHLGYVDGMLIGCEVGDKDELPPGLGMRECGLALLVATGRCIRTNWSPEDVHEAAQYANWSLAEVRAGKWAMTCARAFLETCDEVGCGIEFSD